MIVQDIVSQMSKLPLLLLTVLSASALFAQTNPYQSPNSHFGVSGGNVYDSSKVYCCSGTLGSLVKDGTGGLYILSNNHVLARADRAVPGEPISQPGLIDNRCQPPATVANFTAAAKLGTNVDAAIAAVLSGKMDTSGYIEGIGTIGDSPATPALSLGVMKSGRTTGTTTGSISSIGTSVKVQYQQGCGNGKKFTILYRNQMVINGSAFSAGGDSGSLIVTDSSCHQPIGLLFAGSSTTTIANPISEVLTTLGKAAGRALSFVGTGCSGKQSVATPSQTLVDYASDVAREQAPGFLAHGPVLGVGVGTADENPYEAVIVVYIDRTQGNVPDLPAQARGVRVKRVLTDPIIAGGGCCNQCR